jgi:LTXXQ motif family protein
MPRQLAAPPRITARDRAATRVDQRRTAVQTRLERLQQRAERGRLSRVERGTLRRLERAQRQLSPALATSPRDQQRTARAARLTPQQAMRGRFAANFGNPDRAARSHDRARRLAARLAWRLGLHAAFVPWQGPVYWPYAYDDIFHYAFWPDGYEPGYWAYAFDDFYDGIFFPDGAPYVGYAYPGPYYQGADVRQTTGSVRAPQMPGRVTQATRTFCAEQAKGITAWPFARIEQAVRPINDQKDLLADLKKAAAEAAAQFRDACPDAVPLTPAGRLEAMTMRLQATLAAIKLVRPALAAFYESLEDEQKARFNEIGPDLAREPRTAQSAAQGEAANCKGAQASLAELPIERIDAIVRPTQAQEAGLTRLHDAIARSAARLAEVCAAAMPRTPVGRLDAMQRRVEAMIAAAEDIRPALEAFYVSLDDEQKAKFNRLSRVSAQAGN